VFPPAPTILPGLRRDPASEKLTPRHCPLIMVRHYLVKGRVQGVGFRWYVHREAAALELNGWVRNTEDGHVEVLAAGAAEDLSELSQALRKGSRGSRVDSVIEHELDESEAAKLGPFQIEGAW
jgi:acylphosphatase